MQTFTAPGDIFPDEGVVSKVDEIPASGAPKFYINVDDLKAAIDVGFFVFFFFRLFFFFTGNQC